MSDTESRRLELLRAEVDAEDLSRARATVQAAVQKAKDDWLPKHLIASALALELQACISNDNADSVASFLRHVADSIDSRSAQVPKYH